MTKPRKHKLTRRSLLNWAKRQVAANPTYTESEWDAEKRTFVEKAHTNTPQRVLAMLLQQRYLNDISEYKASELREVLADFAWNGTDAYKLYTLDRCLDELLEAAKDYGEISEETVTVEGLVDFCS